MQGLAAADKEQMRGGMASLLGTRGWRPELYEVAPSGLKMASPHCLSALSEGGPSPDRIRPMIAARSRILLG
jgi:hypothetical protein